MNKTEILGGTLATMMLLSGCKAANETNRTPTAETAVLPASAIKVELIAEMSVDQENALNGLKGLEYKNALKKYAEYWEKVKLIGPGVTVGLGVMPNMKDVTDFSSMLFYFELPGQDYVGKKCTLPWAQYQKYLATGDYQQLLPPDSDELLTNTDPFCLSSEVTENSAPAVAGIPLGSLLANLDGQPVYIDPVTKEVVGILDAESIKWQAKESFTAEKLAFVPHSMEEIGQSVEVRSPIDDPNGYKEEFNDKIKPGIDEILANYSGKIIKPDTIGRTAIDPGIGVVMFEKGAVLNPIASSRFEYNGNMVPILYFPAEDKNGRFVVGVMLSPTKMYSSGYKGEKQVFNWTINDMLKKFPVTVVNMVKVSYVDHGNNKEPLYIEYFAKNVNSGYEAALWNYFLKEDGTFDRNYESMLMALVSIVEYK